MTVTTPTHICQRSSYRIIRASGADIRAYLQTQLTQDVQQLKTGQALYAVALTPQGKAVADMYMMEDDNQIYLVAVAEAAEDLVHRLRRFALGHDVRIGICADDVLLSVQGDTSSTMLQSLAPHTLCSAWMPEAAPQGYWCIVAQQDISNIMTSVQPHWCSNDAMEHASIYHGTPRFLRDWDAKTSPMNANIEDMHGISFQKGCYVGQEIMSRMHWRGSVRSKLYQVALPDMPNSIPCPIASSIAIGTLSAAATQDGQVRGIASLPIEVVEQGAALYIQGTEQPITVLQACQLAQPEAVNA